MRHRLRTMAPGRVEPPEAVRLAAGTLADTPAPGLARSLLDGLRELAGTTGPVLPLAQDDEAVWDAVLTGLLDQGDRVLTVEGGPCGRRLTAAGARRGLDMTAVGAPPGRSLDADVLERALATDTSFGALLLPAVEAATGASHPLAELAGVALRHDVLMLVDGGHALGVSPVHFDATGLDVLVSAGHKGLMQPPGTAVAALSARAWQRLESRDAATAMPDLLDARQRCLAGELPRDLTNPMAAALHAAVAELAAQGAQTAFARNRALAAMFRAGVLAMGLDTVSMGPHADALTAVRLPAGVLAELLAMAMGEEYGVLAEARADAPEELAGRVLTLAHCAPLDYGDVLAALAALRACLPLVGGHSACRDALETAMAAYEQAVYGPEPGPDN